MRRRKEKRTEVFRRYTFRLYPTSKQEAAMLTLLRLSCDVFNAALQERKDAWEMCKVSVNYIQQSGELSQLRLELDPDHPLDQRLERFGSCVVRGTLLRVQNAFDGFFRRIQAGTKPGYPRFKSFRRYDSVEYPRTESWKVVEPAGKARDGRLYLQGVGQVKMRMHHKIVGEMVTLTVRRRGRHWEASVCTRSPAPTPVPHSGDEVVIGVDRGVNVLAATSEGVLHPNPRVMRSLADRVASLQRQLARQKRGSRRRAKTLAALRQLRVREARTRKDNLHKLSRTLAQPGAVVVFEDLKIKQMTKSAKGTVESPGTNVAQKAGLNRAITDAGWEVLAQLTRYKVEETGGRVELVPPHHSSQTCNRCGHLHGDDRRGLRWKCCACGLVEHADVNAARVLVQRYARAPA